MSRFKRNFYSIEKFVYRDHRHRYVRNENGYLFADGIYPTKIKAEDLPEWYVYGRFYKRFGYMSVKGVVDLKYFPNMWTNHFLKDDALLISYQHTIQQISNEGTLQERYSGFDEYISGNAILSFLKAARQYSACDIAHVVIQIQDKANALPAMFPEDFRDFEFNVQKYIDG